MGITGKRLMPPPPHPHSPRQQEGDVEGTVMDDEAKPGVRAPAWPDSPANRPRGGRGAVRVLVYVCRCERICTRAIRGGIVGRGSRERGEWARGGDGGRNGGREEGEKEGGRAGGVGWARERDN